MIRPHHALEDKVLEVFAKLRHKGQPHFVLVLPDGSRSYVPVGWTDFVATPGRAAPGCAVVASASDLLHLRQRVDGLLHRIEDAPTQAPTASTQPTNHATATTGVVEWRTTPDSATLSPAHALSTGPSGPSSGGTDSQAGTTKQHAC